MIAVEDGIVVFHGLGISTCFQGIVMDRSWESGLCYYDTGRSRRPCYMNHDDE